MNGKDALLDSNIFIYISQNTLDINKFILQYENIHASVISYMEVAGFNFASENEKKLINELFKEIDVIYIDETIVEKVIEIRKKKKIKLPDAIVYATASVNNLDLITRNVADFIHIDDSVNIINPFD